MTVILVWHQDAACQSLLPSYIASETQRKHQNHLRNPTPPLTPKPPPPTTPLQVILATKHRMKIPAATPVPEGPVQQPTPLYTSRPTAVPEGPVQQTTLSTLERLRSLDGRCNRPPSLHPESDCGPWRAGATDHPLWLRSLEGQCNRPIPLPFGATGVPGGLVQQTTTLLQLPLDRRRRADNPHVYAGRTCMRARE